MPSFTLKRIPGKLEFPPEQAEFDALPLQTMVQPASGPYVRVGGTDRLTGKFRPAVYFSTSGRTRFDPVGGAGALYVGGCLAAGLMEVFNDRWGPENSSSRNLTVRELRERSVTMIDLPAVSLLDVTGRHLARLGTDSQLFAGPHEVSRRWAERIMHHPAQVDGILYRSRHDPNRLNVALFGRQKFLSAQLCPRLLPEQVRSWRRLPAHGAAIVYGPSIPLRDHPGLGQALDELQVGILPEPGRMEMNFWPTRLVG